LYKPRKKHLVYSLIAFLIISSGICGFNIGRVLSNGSGPVIDELKGIYNFLWGNFTQGIKAPKYTLIDDLDVIDITDILEYPILPYSYMIFNESNIFHAKNGFTGHIDYSGLDCDDIIQNVIDSLNNGGIIFFKNGIYPIDSALNISNNILLRGEGKSSILKLIDNSNINMINIIGNNVIIMDMTIDGNGQNQLGEECNIAIQANSNHTWIINTYLIDAYGDAIEARGNHGVIARNYIENPKEHSIHIHGIDWDILNNYICGDNATISFWSDILTPSDILILRNRFEKINEGPAIHLGYGGNPTNHISIRDNKIIDCLVGILIGSSGGIDITIENNKIIGCKREAISLNSENILNELHIIENKIFNNSQEGDNLYSAILLVANTEVFNNWMISHNTIKSTGVPHHRYGLLIDGTGTLNQLLIDSNILEGSIWANVQIRNNLAGVGQEIKNNLGYITYNSGTQICSNNEYIAHGLAKTPNFISVTSMNDTYENIPIITTLDWSEVSTTNIKVGIYWVNGTAISDDIILVSWEASYKP
jgi:hypothetical protein